MQNEVITIVWEKDGRLYGRTGSGFPMSVFNLQKTPESILEYDFSNVVEGRELVAQYIKQDDTDAS